MTLNYLNPELYEKRKQALFTDTGQRLVIDTRDNILRALKNYGAFRLRNFLANIRYMSLCKQVAEESGLDYRDVAPLVVHRLVELGDIVELPFNPMIVSWGNRIFTDGRGGM